MLNILRRYKHAVLPRGVAPRTVLSGFMRGVRMERDFDGEAQHVLGLYERELTPWLHRLSRGVNTGIDVGSADGMFPLYFLLKTPAKRVLGFEPTERREKLFRNMAANDLSGDPRFTLHPLFVGARVGEGMTTLDSHLADVTTPCLVKIDVEGAEADVLRGATKLLQMPGVSWIIETHSLELERECIRIFQEAGYRTEIVLNAIWRRWLPNGRTMPHNQWLVAYRA